ncbi:MAG: Acid stress protein IbaG [Chlamydiia bacterium]|nr:Acid stress protein IbaG [Chlamydiia bacterium]MCH9616005.1 Acid stress protein IbaG [Chlamydiia bacterium]MCH9629028.1 Acid stress protein IbaG [Chlamydiia bacterium]
MEQIESAIKDAIEGAEVHILDPRGDGVHLEAIVVSKGFEGMSLLKRQRLVMDALKDQFELGLHALALKTYTPEQWAEQ